MVAATKPMTIQKAMQIAGTLIDEAIRNGSIKRTQRREEMRENLNTLAEYMILSGADNRPPMLDKDLYDSWKSRMEIYMQNREHGRMILESVENGPLIWPTVEENGVIRTKKHAELSAAEKIQADCNMKATNIILQGLPADIYSLVNHHRVAKDLWERVQLLMQVSTQLMIESPLVDSGFAVRVFSLGDDPIACLNKAMAFLTAIASLRSPSTNNQLRTSSNPRSQATIQDSRVTVQQVQGRQGQSYSGTGYKSNATSSGGNNASGHSRVVKCYNCQGEGHMARQCTQPK
ncbi:gag-pol polyprotein [Tanacetum coccineum]